MEDSSVGFGTAPTEDEILQGAEDAVKEKDGVNLSANMPQFGASQRPMENSSAYSGSEAEEDETLQDVREGAVEESSASLLPLTPLGRDKGRSYACPRCRLYLVDFQSVQLHLVRSARCRAAVKETKKAALMRQFREAAVALQSTMSSPSQRRLSSPQLETVKETSKLTGEKQTAHQGLGSGISGVDGSYWGRVIAEDRRSWRLDTGRSARKTGHGRQWKWTAHDSSSGQVARSGPDTTPVSTSALSPTFSCTSSEASPFMLPSPAQPDPDLLILEEAGPVLSVRSAPGVGDEILGADGNSWGLVATEERACWRLSDGRIARKSTQGRKWHWAPKAQHHRSSSEEIQPADRDQCSTDPCLGDHVGSSMGGLTTNCEIEADTAGSAVAGNQTGRGPELFLDAIASCLPLKAALNVMGVCRDWKETLKGFLPLTLPPPQIDKFLEFCLLEVLVKFDDNRLPVPVSAIYSEMRMAARRAITSSCARAHLEQIVSCKLGHAFKTQQEQFLREGRSHHIAWTADVKSSGFRSLERLAKHFDGNRLIEIFHQRWHKRIHHSPNTRTCTEWLMTNVNRNHPLFIEHENWLRSTQ